MNQVGLLTINRSIILHNDDVRAIGLYDSVLCALMHVFLIGITIECFHESLLPENIIIF